MYKILKIDGLRKEYWLYDNGDLWDVECQRMKTKIPHKKGYYKYSFWINGKEKKIFIHRLVLMTFNPVDGMEKLQVNHIDGDKSNNNLSNLEWCTQSENQKHAFKMGLLSRKGEKNSQAKLTENDVYEICYMLLDNIPIKEIADKFNVSKSLISLIKNHKKWADISSQFDFDK